MKNWRAQQVRRGLAARDNRELARTRRSRSQPLCGHARARLQAEARLCRPQ